MLTIFARKRPQALVLDDEPPFEKLFTLMMTMLDWDCEVVTCREVALARLKTANFDVLITDYHLPKGNGLHFICRLRQEGITLPAILMSGDARVLDMAPKEMLSISAVLHKPFKVSELKEALAKIPKA